MDRNLQQTIKQSYSIESSGFNLRQLDHTNHTNGRDMTNDIHGFNSKKGIHKL